MLIKDEKFLLCGFGRKPEIADIYKIPEFIIKGKNESLTFPNLYMASSFGRNFGCDLILSATMFKQMDYAILNRKKDTSVLEITYDRDIYYTQLMPILSPDFTIEDIHKLRQYNYEMKRNMTDEERMA